MTEADVQREVVSLYHLAGCAVLSLSQGRATRQTEGTPDLFVTGHNYVWWHEVKTPKGKLRPEQAAWKVIADQTPCPVIVGGVDAAMQQLEQVGLIVSGGLRQHNWHSSEIARFRSTVETERAKRKR